MACAQELESVIRRIGPESVAAFIAEPVVGSTVGALVPPDGYWRKVREITERYDVLLIADEVMSGIGRTGKPFCVDHWQVVPDIITSAKGIAGGYVPAGAVCVSETIADAIREGSGRFLHGFTYNASPVSTTAIEAVIRHIKEHRLIENAACRGLELRQELRRLEDFFIVGEVRGKGLMWGLELVADKESRMPFPASTAAAEVIADECIARGLVVYPGGGMVDGVAGDNVLIAPPLSVNEEQIKEIGSILLDALGAADKELRKARDDSSCSAV